MRKHEFLAALEKTLVDHSDAREIISYYDELISEALLNGENEENFIKHLGSPKEIKRNLTNDGNFKQNSATKLNFNTTTILPKVTKTFNNIGFVIVAIFLFMFGLGFIATGTIALASSVYYFFTGYLSTNIIFYHVFNILMQASIIFYGVLCFAYIARGQRRRRNSGKIVAPTNGNNKVNL